jgi:hypothetical protein
MFGIEFGESLIKMIEARRGRKSADRLLTAIIAAIYMGVALIAVALIAAFASLIDYIAPAFEGLTVPSYLTMASISIVVLSLIVVIGSIIVFRLIRRIGVAQSALNELARLRDVGINTLYANPPSGIQDVNRWISDHDKWEIDVKKHLAATFPPADLSRFTNLGVIIAMQFAPGMIVDPRHENKMRALAKQLDTLDEFLASYRGR